MKSSIAIMQPYFLPYIGYFQLIKMVDTFVIYDNIQFSKKGWINRNRILLNKEGYLITLPLKKDSDYLNVNERQISISFERDKIKMLARIKNAYIKSPHFKDVYPLVEKIFSYSNYNLFSFVYNSILLINDFLNISTKIIISSSLELDLSLKGREKVIEICKALSAEEYINTIGGVKLYDKEMFLEKNIKLQFLESMPIVYNQLNNEFVPNLSILDVMMFNSKEEIIEFLNQYTLK